MAKGKPKSVQQPKDKGEKLFSVTMSDCDLDTFSAGGPGGQHQNTSNTAVRIKHRESGAVGEARDSKSQTQNKQAAFRRMTEDPKFKIWLNRQIYFSGKSPEQRVKDDMNSRNLKVETYRNDEWHVTY